MIRKLFWALALVAIACTVTGVVVSAAARRRRELWSEATD